VTTEGWAEVVDEAVALAPEDEIVDIGTVSSPVK
jgi:hypothetical protein